MADQLTPECAAVLDDLAGLLDDRLEPRLREHVVDCDRCRDLRHEVRATAQRLPSAGGDYVHPEGFEARLLASLDARGPSAERPRDAPPTSAAARPAAASAPAATSAYEPPAREASPATPPERAREAPAPAEARPAPRRPVPWMALGLTGAVLAAAALPAAFFLRGRGAGEPSRGASAGGTAASGSSSEPSAGIPGDPVGPWQGRAVEVARAGRADEGAAGLELRSDERGPFRPLAQGAAIPAGAELRTDGRTRARVDLADGTRLVLDRGTHLRLDARTPRAARLLAGSLVADVAHRGEPGAPVARIETNVGAVTVLGTKFALTASEQQSTVRVSRGVVQLANSAGAQVEVKTGFEGTLQSAGAPRVAPAVGLARALAWSELGAQPRVEADAPVVGLGELRARRPGQTDERDHAVKLVSHAVRVRIVGNQARTEIDETFENDTERELEGIYRFPLPPQAQVERLALDVNGQMEDGAFVDRTRAAAIWRGVLRNAVRPMQQRVESEELVWVPGPWRDPALLEWQRGGRFELRIFPIPARGSRRVTIAYTQTIEPSAGVRRYVYPLAHDANGSTRVEQFDVDVQVLGHDAAQGVRARGYALAEDPARAPRPGASRLAFSQSNFVPAGDLVLEYALPDEGAGAAAWAFVPAPGALGAAAPGSNRAAGGGGLSTVSAAAPSGAPEAAYVAIALRPELPRWTDARERDYALVLDTSRSMVGERLARARRLLLAAMAEMDPRDRVTVLACDTSCRVLPGGLRHADGEAARAAEAFLQGEDAHGASDLVSSVREAAALVGTARERDARIVYFGDGAATTGWRAPDAIEAEVTRALATSEGRATVTAVAVGNDADATSLAALARAGGGAVVPYTPGESANAAALAVLEATYGVTLREPRVELPAGLSDAAPTRLATVRAGSEVLLVARMNAAEVRGDVVLRGTVGGQPFETRHPLVVQASTHAGNAFVPRLYAATKIAELEAQGTPAARDEAVALSQRFHVASRYTSLLVLEGDAMYRAFGVERNRDTAVAWTGDEDALPTQVRRAPPALAARPAAEPAGANDHAPAAAPAETTTARREAERADAPAAAAAALGALQGAVNAQGAPVLADPEASEEQRALGLGLSGTGLGGAGSGEANIGALGGLATGGGAGSGVGSGMGLGARGRSAGGAAAGPARAGLSANSGDDDDAPPLDAPAPAAAAEAPSFGDAAAHGSARDALAGAGRASLDLGNRATSGAGEGAPSQLFGNGARQQPLRPRAAPAPAPSVTRSTAAPARRPRGGLNILDDTRDAGFTGPGSWMRRVWVRRATLEGDRAVSDTVRSRVAAARTALLAMPDSRTRHQELYRWLAIAGDVDEAGDVARRWSERDALDPDALVRLSDVAARRGERDKAVRILSGTVDVRSGDPAHLERLVALFERAGDTARACPFRVSLAELSPQDAERVGAAVRCERALGHHEAVTRLLVRVRDEAARRRIEASAGDAAQDPSASAAPRGNLVLRALWDAPTDLDLAVVDARGNRVSWLGGRARGLTARDPRGLGSEALGLARLGTGDYFLEVSRSSVDGPAARGTIEATALGERRSFSFVLLPGQSTARVGRMVLRRESQLVAF